MSSILALCVDGYRAVVERHLEVEVTGLNRFGQPIKVDAAGWQTRILQHECDHLKGTLYVDKMVPKTFRIVKNLNLPLAYGHYTIWSIMSLTKKCRPGKQQIGTNKTRPRKTTHNKDWKTQTSSSAMPAFSSDVYISAQMSSATPAFSISDQNLESKGFVLKRTIEDLNLNQLNSIFVAVGFPKRDTEKIRVALAHTDAML
ncbi:hypothetical protein QQ045_029277 [Rhodiola kirilowii]